jgi:hypothetical protein
MLQLYLWHDSYAIVLKIKQELYIASGSASTKENFWVRAYFFSYQTNWTKPINLKVTMYLKNTKLEFFSTYKIRKWDKNTKCETLGCALEHSSHPMHTPMVEILTCVKDATSSDLYRDNTCYD